LAELLFDNDLIRWLDGGSVLRIVSINLNHPCILRDESIPFNDDWELF
jgi:hypothetical protein